MSGRTVDETLRRRGISLFPCQGTPLADRSRYHRLFLVKLACQELLVCCRCIWGNGLRSPTDLTALIHKYLWLFFLRRLRIFWPDDDLCSKLLVIGKPDQVSRLVNAAFLSKRESYVRNQRQKIFFIGDGGPIVIDGPACGADGKSFGDLGRFALDF